MWDPERWEGHPSIPEKVFGPTEYLSSPTRKAPRFQNAVKSSQATTIEDFKATKPLDAKIPSMSAKFAAWFDATFADSDAWCRHKAIQASREAASTILEKARKGGTSHLRC